MSDTLIVLHTAIAIIVIVLLILVVRVDPPGHGGRLRSHQRSQGAGERGVGQLAVTGAAPGEGVGAARSGEVDREARLADAGVAFHDEGAAGAPGRLAQRASRYRLRIRREARPR